MKINTLLENKSKQWRLGAMTALARHGKDGGEFKTKLWANGETMVTPKTEWATAMHAVPRAIALEIYNNGWVIPRHLI